MSAATEEKPDIEKLRATLSYIKQYPDQWDQRHSASREVPRRTTYSFDGLAVVLDGATPLWTGMTLNARRCVFRGQYPERIKDRAKRVLGLTDTQAEALFKKTNSLKELETIVKQIERGKLR